MSCMYVYIHTCHVQYAYHNGVKWTKEPVELVLMWLLGESGGDSEGEKDAAVFSWNRGGAKFFLRASGDVWRTTFSSGSFPPTAVARALVTLGCDMTM
jgi:hypothetical protein